MITTETNESKPEPDVTRNICGDGPSYFTIKMMISVHRGNDGHWIRNWNHSNISKKSNINLSKTHEMSISHKKYVLLVALSINIFRWEWWSI